ncbi:M48 family metallopeptidase [Ferrimonas balearica]|uniref:M48 family metallopeptidase n=1 Tax=Ferrimonas balearica TaxID=44012 RepID=UPI001C99A404|nr:M48 family metallopeptidase [Ferrimonas balearica]MBY5991286.1 M48 family metallopeptidase [Ferrimonas balearica]
MSRFENRPPPENNVSDQHPLAEFAWLGAAAIGLLVALTLALMLLGHSLARFVPFAWEQNLAPGWHQSHDDLSKQRALQTLLADLLAADPLPEGMSVHLTLADGEVLNAMAGLGGEILIYEGLVDALDNEVAVAFVLAHEVAHIRSRDVMENLLGHSAVALVWAALAGSDTRLLELTAAATQLGMGRQQELEADARAIETLLKHYGHLNGAERVFEVLHQDSALGDWLSSHPDSETRLAQILAAQAENP